MNPKGGTFTKTKFESLELVLLLFTQIYATAYTPSLELVLLPFAFASVLNKQSLAIFESKRSVYPFA